MTKAKPSALLMADFPENGGSKVYFLLFVDFFLEHGYKVDVILAGKESLSPEDEKFFDKKGVSVCYILPEALSPGNWVKKFRLQQRKELQFFKLITGEYDKVVVSTNTPYRWMSGARVFRDKFYYFVHSYPVGEPSKWTRRVAFIRRLYYKSLSKTGAKFVTVSKTAAKILQEQFLLSEKHLPFSVVPGPGKFLPKAYKKTSKNIVLTVGHLERWKNPTGWLFTALFVCKHHNDARFWWVGDGSYFDEISEMIPFELADRIRLLGYYDDVSEFYESAAIYFQPSRIESQGFGVIDAMAHSLPCVVSDRGGLPESVEHQTNGFICKDGVILEPANYILDLLKDESLQKKMGEAGCEIYRKKFTHEVWERNMKDLLF